MSTEPPAFSMFDICRYLPDEAHLTGFDEKDPGTFEAAQVSAELLEAGHPLPRVLTTEHRGDWVTVRVILDPPWTAARLQEAYDTHGMAGFFEGVKDPKAPLWFTGEPSPPWPGDARLEVAAPSPNRVERELARDAFEHAARRAVRIEGIEVPLDGPLTPAQREAVRRASPGGAAMWVTYCPHDGWEIYDTETAAREALDGILDMLRDESADGWHEAAEEAAVYRLTPVARVRLTVTDRAEDDTEGGEQCREAGWDFIATGEVVEVEQEPTTYTQVVRRLAELDAERTALRFERTALRFIRALGFWRRTKMGPAAFCRHGARDNAVVREDTIDGGWLGSFAGRRITEGHETAEQAMAAVDAHLLAEGWTLDGGVP